MPTMIEISEGDLSNCSGGILARSWQTCILSKNLVGFFKESTKNALTKHRNIFRDTLIAKTYGEREVRNHDLLAGKQKKFKHQLGFKLWTYNLNAPP